ncbi:hypothetical protein HLB23_36135 [Nocardia uniformis]|uniref:Uncharacterized protein n=1 Tax=Nocardia uniformis TaxID=53432 RepID=A0A849C9G2_9NOCA|nr:DUF6412 domain-containing protein [Nocardia uniformis]NNH75222.1 hypothetical protein [Nocardia uniformis]
MFTWIRVTALMAVTLMLATWAMVLTNGVDSESLVAIGATTVLTLAVLAVLPAKRPMALVAVSSGPPESARRRRGAFQRQSNPDTAGRPRPRAPGWRL